MDEEHDAEVEFVGLPFTSWKFDEPENAIATKIQLDACYTLSVSTLELDSVGSKLTDPRYEEERAGERRPNEQQPVCCNGLHGHTLPADENDGR